MFDVDEWIRSLAEAQEITADVPEESVTCDQQAVDPKHSSSHPDGRIPAETHFEATLSCKYNTS